MQPPLDGPPDTFSLPSLPAAVHEWFAYVADLDEDSELIYDGAILDNLGVVDEASARQALTGYRFTYDNGTWVDQAEHGQWNANWIVLDSIDADPIIADVSTPEVAVFEDEHGRGYWDPRPSAASLREFIDSIDRNDDVPGPPPIDASFDWSVWAVDLGPDPMKTLLNMQKWPLFDSFTRSELLALRTSLPARVSHELDEDGARSCVEHAARDGATFEARTYSRGSTGAFMDADLEGLWSDASKDDYAEPAPSDQLIESIEAEIGFRLPDSYIELARHRNGGPLARGAYSMTEPTGWADDHIAVTGIYAIGRSSRYSLAGELGARFMRDEWGYPAWGIGIADTPTAGHEQIMLDYRDCGPEGEPQVVYVDQEDDYRVTVVAPDFATFIRGLTDEDHFAPDPDSEKEAAIAAVERGSFSPIVVRALAASSDLRFAERSLRRLGRAIVDRLGYFAVQGDGDSRMLLDAMFLLHGRLRAPADFDDYVRFDGRSSEVHPTLEAMLFFSVGDPFDYCTRGYAPDFVKDWWDARTAEGSIRSTETGWRYTAAAEHDLIVLLQRTAEG